jgi:hypothetical protein
MLQRYAYYSGDDRGCGNYTSWGSSNLCISMQILAYTGSIIPKLGGRES